MTKPIEDKGDIAKDRQEGSPEGSLEGQVDEFGIITPNMKGQGEYPSQILVENTNSVRKSRGVNIQEILRSRPDIEKKRCERQKLAMRGNLYHLRTGAFSRKLKPERIEKALRQEFRKQYPKLQSDNQFAELQYSILEDDYCRYNLAKLKGVSSKELSILGDRLTSHLRQYNTTFANKSTLSDGDLTRLRLQIEGEVLDKKLEEDGITQQDVISYAKEIIVSEQASGVQATIYNSKPEHFGKLER